MLGAQQVAFAHYIGHIDCVAGSVGTDQDSKDVSHHECTTCAAFAGLTGGAPPAFVASIGQVDVTATSFQDISSDYLPTRTASPYTARAPPVVL